MRRLACSVVGVCLGALSVLAGGVPAGATPAPGVITGSVDDSTTGTPVSGVCVYAYAVTNYPPGVNARTGAHYQTTTAGDGSYEFEVPAGEYVVRFDPACGGQRASSYAVQYFAGQLDFQSANAVPASAVSPAVATDAHLVTGYSLSGTVGLPRQAGGAGATCVSADDAAGYAVNTARTGPEGAYEISNLPAGTYTVYFDPTCGRSQASTVAAQYYGGAASAGGAEKVALYAEVAGVDAQLVEGGTIRGTLTAPGAANDAGICAYAIGPDGVTDGQSVTDVTGAYVLADLAPQAYTINFDPTCSHSQGSYFGPQAYPKRLALGAGQALGGVDAKLALVSGTPVAITQTSLAEGQVFHRYYRAVSVSVPTTEASPWKVSGLPRGLTGGDEVSFSDQDAAIEGDIYGIPQVAGTFSVTVTVTTDGVVPPLLARKTFKLVVLAANPVVSVDSPTIQASGHFAPVRLGCTYLACSGRAQLATKQGVVLASASYVLAKSTSSMVRLVLTNVGSVALSKAKLHPVNAELEVTVRGGKEVTKALRVS